jgi:hypothetical protein
MSLLDQFSNVLKQYTSGSTQNAANGTEHFDQVAQAAPQSVIAEGLSAVFRSDQTPAFGNLVSSLFSQSNGDQKAGMLNHLIASVLYATRGFKVSKHRALFANVGNSQCHIRSVRGLEVPARRSSSRPPDPGNVPRRLRTRSFWPSAPPCSEWLQRPDGLLA